MKKRTLGRTGLKVSELSLGGLFVSSVGGAFEQGRDAIHRAIELGVNYIDTAPTYANSEEVLGKALEGVDAPLFISTKLGGRPQPFLPQDKDCLMKSVEESLRLLKRDRVDMLFVHEPDRTGQYAWWTNLETFDGPVVEFLEDMKRQKIIRFTGLGGTTAYELARIIRTGKFDVVLTAFNYSLLWREAEHAILPAAKEHNLGVVIGSPLHQGSLSRRCDKEVRDGCPWLSPPRRKQLLALYAFLDELGMALPELALRFVLSNPDVSCALMGARSRQEVDLNVASVEKGPLPKDVLKRLDEIYAIVPFRPFEEPAVLHFGSQYRGLGGVR
jgi:aryl-alcohol dehydrogenase-like predicted oxidoreductase